MPGTTDRLARALHAARQGDERLALQRPASLQQAYEIQEALDALDTSATVGLKIGATLQGALGALELDAPFHGRLRAAHHHANAARVTLPRSHPVSVETEFVVGFAQDLQLEPHAHDVRTIPAHLRERVAAAVGYVVPGFEFVGNRFDMTLAGNGLALVADAAGNVGTVLGDAIDGAHHDLDLAACGATLTINGASVASGLGSDSLGAHPYTMIAWLLGQPGTSARGIRAGEFVFCGTCTGALPVSPGDDLSADFGPLGRVSATLA